MAPPLFEVRVAGVVPEQDLLDLGVVAKATQIPQTVLYGEIRDESTLFGLLDRLRALGIEVVEVRRVPDYSPMPTQEPVRPDTPLREAEPGGNDEPGV